MILHVVLFTPRADLDGAAQQGLVQAFSDAVEQIGSIRRSRIGTRRTHGREYERLMKENYTHAAILEFDDLGGLKAYLEHPVHTQLGARFFECFEKALMYDFEMRDGRDGLAALIKQEGL